MKKLLTLAFALVMVFVPLSKIYAEPESGADIQTKIEYNDDETVTVTIPASLASNDTLVKIPCDWLSKPIVMHEGVKVDSILNSGVVEFTAKTAGEYRIVEDTGSNSDTDNNSNTNTGSDNNTASSTSNSSYKVVNTCTK